MALYKGRLLLNQPTAKPRLQLVALEPRRQSRQASAITVLIIAVIFAVVGAVAIALKGF